MLEQRIETHDMLTGGQISLWTIEGMFYVVAVVNGVRKSTDCLSLAKAESFISDAVHLGKLKF